LKAKMLELLDMAHKYHLEPAFGQFQHFDSSTKTSIAMDEDQCDD
jgi:hypothetical protein